jgi:hypothetical protein
MGSSASLERKGVAGSIDRSRSASRLATQEVRGQRVTKREVRNQNKTVSTGARYITVTMTVTESTLSSAPSNALT